MFFMVLAALQSKSLYACSRSHEFDYFASVMKKTLHSTWNIKEVRLKQNSISPTYR